MPGSSSRSQPARPRASATRAARPSRSIFIGDHLTPGARAQGLVDLVIHLVAQVAHVAVAEDEVAAPAVPAEELVDVPPGVARPVALAGMPQDHPRAVLAEAR